MDANAITFTAYLGAAKPFLDIHLDRAPDGEVEVVHGAHRTEYRELEIPGGELNGRLSRGHSPQVFFKLVAEFGNKSGQHGAYTQVTWTKSLLIE